LRNFALDSALVRRHLHAVMARVMRQDVAVIEAIEATAPARRTGPARPECSRDQPAL